MSITVNIRYSGKGNAALDFAKEMTESGTVEKIRAEKGNVRYEYFVPLSKLREKYDLHMSVERFVPGGDVPESDESFIKV